MPGVKVLQAVGNSDDLLLENLQYKSLRVRSIKFFQCGYCIIGSEFWNLLEDMGSASPFNGGSLAIELQTEVSCFE